MKEKEKPYSFIAPRTGNRWSVVKVQSLWHLRVDNCIERKFSKGEQGIMTFRGHKTLKEANAHAKEVEQMLLAENKGG